ncbi:MAG TPA: large conductance mechanosensitive channel protein MscL [Chthonomonadales bacterium]|nr:large conductance mechanosensitive channel protein MscL [Chthonomonadales bacterium]
MLKEFREFALKGNVIDLAVGLILGAAFGRIVTSLVEDVIMPPVGLLMGRADFSSLFFDMSGGGHASLEAARQAGAAVIAYGAFINTIIAFVVVAFAMFVLVRQINRLRREPVQVAPDTRECPFCVSPIALRATRCPMCTAEMPAA